MSIKFKTCPIFNLYWSVRSAFPSNIGKTQKGFTLIELLITLSLVGLLAGLSWRGLDGLARSQTASQERLVQTARLQTVLAQWQADLHALQGVQGFEESGLLWDGQVLRIIRRSSALTANGSEPGLWVVAWSRRGAAQVGQGMGQWVRWQSPPCNDRMTLKEAWDQAARWGQNPSSSDMALETPLLPLDSWQLVYFLGNAWINPLSSRYMQGFISPDTGAFTTFSKAKPPDAIRLMIDLPAETGFGGRLTLDWVAPTFSPGAM